MFVFGPKESKQKSTMTESDGEIDDEPSDSGNRLVLPRYKDRAQKADVVDSLRCAVRLFHDLHKDVFVKPLQEEMMDYCDYISAFIGGVWLNSVRTLIAEEFKAKGVTDKVISRYKTRVSSYLRFFFAREYGKGATHFHSML